MQRYLLKLSRADQLQPSQQMQTLGRITHNIVEGWPFQIVDYFPFKLLKFINMSQEGYYNYQFICDSNLSLYQRSLQIFTHTMNNLCGLRCYLCSNLLMDFVMLACNHTICSECLSSYTDPDQDMITVPCKCGLTTNIPSQKNRESSSQFLKTYTSLPSIPSIQRNKTQIFDQSYFTIYEGENSGLGQKCKKIGQYDLKNREQKQLKGNSLTNYLLNQLGNEVKFMELRFKRYLNQINRYYNRLMIQLNKNYDHLKRSLIDKCKVKIEIGQIKCLSSIQRTIQKLFKPKMQAKLIQVSKELSKFINKNTNLIQNGENKENQKKNNDQRQNTYRKSESNGKRNRHDSCKIQKGYTPIHNIKQNMIKQSKIRKKLYKKSHILFQ